jgi:hypothetical protein
MGRLSILAAAMLAAIPAGGAAQYETPANPPDPTAQIAEMIEIYDSVCLHAFPDDDAVARALAERGATPMSRDEVRGILRDDPGRGWNLTGRTARFRLILEAPPYHACGLRTMTATGLPDPSPYRALANRFETGGDWQNFGPQAMDLENVHSVSGGTESLMVFLTTPDDKHRDAEHSAVEVRFVHQIYRGH